MVRNRALAVSVLMAALLVVDCGVNGRGAAEAIAPPASAVLAQPQQQSGLPPPGAVSTVEVCGPGTAAALKVFDNGNLFGVLDRPSVPTTFTLTGATCVTSIMTYHYNGGRGAPAGEIALRDAAGRNFGSWPVSAHPRADRQGDGKVGLYWFASPRIVLPPGTYTVVDSDIATWSHNDQSGRRGITQLFARPVVRVAAPIAPPVPQPPTPPQSVVATAPPKQGNAAADAFKSFTTALEKFELYEKSKNLRDWQAGLTAAQHAVDLQPRTADYWRILGYAYALGGAEVDLASALAEEAYEKSIALDPKNTGSRMLLAALLLERESYSRALDNIEAALTVKPELASSAVVADMCRIYIIDEQTERGAAYLEAFVARSPRVTSARLGLAILLKEENRTAEAVRLAAKVANDPEAAQTDSEHAKALLKAWRG